jgi:hypothetical protein
LERGEGAYLFVLSHSCEERKDGHRRPRCEEQMRHEVECDMKIAPFK